MVLYYQLGLHLGLNTMLFNKSLYPFNPLMPVENFCLYRYDTLLNLESEDFSLLVDGWVTFF